MMKAMLMKGLIFLLGIVAVVLAGCGEVENGDAGLERDAQALLTSNALSSNALTTNALTTNALTSNALTTNALTSNALTTNALTSNALLDPAQGESAAQVIRYSARCMLRPDQSVTVTYAAPDGRLVSETYRGNLGLQPRWAEAGLDDVDRRWWAACLAAHVNDHGPVELSVRSDRHAALAVTPSERARFRDQEGAFWATYDPSASPPMHFYACRGSAPDPGAQTRFCSYAGADGGSACGSMFTWTGGCAEALGGVGAACDLESEAGNLDGCRTGAGGAPAHEVITVFLRSPGADR